MLCTQEIVLFFDLTTKIMKNSQTRNEGELFLQRTKIIMVSVGRYKNSIGSYVLWH